MQPQAFGGAAPNAARFTDHSSALHSLGRGISQIGVGLAKVAEMDNRRRRSASGAKATAHFTNGVTEIRDRLAATQGENAEFIMVDYNAEVATVQAEALGMVDKSDFDEYTAKFQIIRTEAGSALFRHRAEQTLKAASAAEEAARAGIGRYLADGSELGQGEIERAKSDLSASMQKTADMHGWSAKQLKAADEAAWSQVVLGVAMGQFGKGKPGLTLDTLEKMTGSLRGKDVVDGDALMEAAKFEVEFGKATAVFLSNDRKASQEAVNALKDPKVKEAAQRALNAHFRALDALNQSQDNDFYERAAAAGAAGEPLDISEARDTGVGLKGRQIHQQAASSIWSKESEEVQDFIDALDAADKLISHFDGDIGRFYEYIAPLPRAGSVGVTGAHARAVSMWKAAYSKTMTRGQGAQSGGDIRTGHFDSKFLDTNLKAALGFSESKKLSESDTKKFNQAVRQLRLVVDEYFNKVNGGSTVTETQRDEIFRNWMTSFAINTHWRNERIGVQEFTPEDIEKGLAFVPEEGREAREVLEAEGYKDDDVKGEAIALFRIINSHLNDESRDSNPQFNAALQRASDILGRPEGWDEQWRVAGRSGP